MVQTGLAGRRRRGSVEHSRNVGLVAGASSNAAACRGVDDVEMVELDSAEGAMDSLTERNDGGPNSGETEHLGEDFCVELPAVVSVVKEVHEGDPGGIDPAGAEGGVQSAGGQAAVRPTDAHGASPRGAAFADEYQEGHALASGGAVTHGWRGRGAGA